jgi:alkyl hydroperoxide reductase subunit AhpC
VVRDSWVFCFHPADFTQFVLLNWELLQIIIEFEKRNTKVIALSVDGLESHLKWIKDIETQNVTLQYPIIADESKTVANLYDMIHPNANLHCSFRFLYSGLIKDKIDTYLSSIDGRISMKFFVLSIVCN